MTSQPTSTPPPAWRLPLCDLRFGVEERRAVDDVLASGWVTTGPLTERFEAEAAQRLGVPRTILLSSCTAALHLALIAMGARPGRACVVPAITFAATANVPALLGMDVVPCDIESPERPVLSRDHLRRILAERPDAIAMPVHYGGYEAPVDDVLADFPDAVVVEDAAHAMGGAGANGQPLGGCSANAPAGREARALGCFSFFSNKNLSTGEGGLLATRDGALADRVRRLRTHGVTLPTWNRHLGSPNAPTASDDAVVERSFAYDVMEPGLNYRPTEIVAALALVGLSKLEARNARRRALIGLYREALAPLGVRLVFDACDDARGSGHLASALFPDAATAKAAKKALAKAGVQTSHHYPPLHRFSGYRAIWGDKVSLPNAEAFSARQLTLPLFPEMVDEDVALVASTLATNL